MVYSKQQIRTFIKNSNKIDGHDFICDERSILVYEYLSKLDRIKKDDIFKIHQLLLLNKTKGEFFGEFRDFPSFICDLDGFQIKLLEPEKINQKINDFIKTQDIYKSLPVDNDKIKFILQHHKLFEHIHPFLRGNGRLGRLIVLWQMQKGGLKFRYFSFDRINQYYNLFIKKVCGSFVNYFIEI